MTAAPGTKTGVGGEFLHYRIEEAIGQGGMGVVYAAQDVRLKRKVALKLMAPELALDERFRARFVRESELAMSLEHPNVIPVHDAGEADGRLYLAMRCVDGSDLRPLLRNEGALDPARALAIVRQIAQALDAAHARGLVHRDVKPSNVLLDESEHVYLADFGLTRRQSEDGAQVGDARSLGTPAYLAPEQLEGGPIDGRADVYSLGCLLYECLTGEPPFPAASRLEVAWAHLEEEPPRAGERNPALPAAVGDVIRKAMAKNPDDRYSTCGELVAAAEAALGLRQPARSRRRLLVLLAATLAAGVAALAVALIGRDDAAVAESLAVRANTLVRIDPARNEIAAVVGTGRNPTATAAAGHSVWVYDSDDHTVSEIDARTNEREHASKVSTLPTGMGLERGPVLAADAGGAWVIGYDLERGKSFLTRVLSDGRGTREQSFGMALEAVAVAERAVWVLARRGDDDLIVLRIDPRSGRVRARTPLRLAEPSGAPLFRRAQVGEGQGLAVGGGYVWVTDAGSGTLHRLDPRTGATRRADFGISVTRPAFGFGRIWLCAWDSENGSMLRVHPRTLENELARDALKAEEGHFAVGYGSLWRVDHPTGTLMRFRPRSGDPAGLVPVRTRAAPGSPYIVLTSISTGADGVWLSVARG